MGPNRVGKHANEGDPEGHVNVQRWEEEFTDGPRIAGACYRPSPGLSTIAKALSMPGGTDNK